MVGVLVGWYSVILIKPKIHTDAFFLKTFLIFQHLLRSFSIGEHTALVQRDPENMAIMKKDKDMKRGDIYFQYTNNVVTMKWFDNRGVTMIGTCRE